MAKYRSYPTRRKYSKIAKGARSFKDERSHSECADYWPRGVDGLAAAREEKKGGAKPEPTIHGSDGESSGCRSSS
jgi:hypothetical protein